ncbi:MAG: prepilin-type N-terminal cleavage/methylation domain-containing protein [Candidatus Wildermuthbacteria bacterium]|nr:prepilin-type N-terminal cleavage/methylation domain-containing protein [Candidatus Wildermuthbacteria bacterium]
MNKGISLIEVIVGSAIISIAMFGIFRFLSFSVANSAISAQFAQANALVQGGMEGVRAFRDGTAWTNNDPNDLYDGIGILQIGASYKLQKSGDNPPQWQLVPGTETVGAFQRTIVFSNVNRDGGDSIAESGGSLDDDTKKATVQVAWSNRGQTYQAQISAYLTNWR